MNFYKHYLGDYARDTGDLSMIEHGAYRVLLDHYYSTKGEMPDDVASLYRIAKAMTPAERRAVDKVADRFFRVNGDGRRHNHRADEEIQKHLGQSEANRLVAEERERRRREQRSLLDPLDESSTNRSPSHSQKPERTKASAANAAEGRGGAATAPDCPVEKLIEIYHEQVPMGTKLEKRTPARVTVMRARWREESKPNRDKHKGYSTAEDGLAYWRRFFAYVAESKFLTGQVEGRDGKPPFVASMPWLLKAENFANVIEGKYHRDF